jgi:hypothetical protein
MTETESLSNGWSCNRCKKLNMNEITVTIEGNKNMNHIYKSKIKPILELCDDCAIHDFKIQILKNEIGEKKEVIKSLNKEISYHKEMLKRFNEKLNLEWENYSDLGLGLELGLGLGLGLG